MKKFAVIPVLAGLALSAAACSGDDPADGSGAAPPSSSLPGGAAPSATTASGPFGAGCSAVPASGKGSFTGMSADPVATAASNNPVLSTLVNAVKEAGLVDTLNSAKGHHRLRSDQ